MSDSDNDNENEILLNKINSIQDISQETRENANKLSKKIMNFKRLLFNTIVTNDKEYTPEDLKPLEIYLQVFQQSIQFWIDLLQNKSENIEPFFEKKTTMYNNFKNLTRQILEYSKYDTDSPILVNSILLKFYSQHPYIFNSDNK
jgi:small-conductance mechanosensitive channel